MWLGIGVGIGRQRFVSGSSGIFSAYAARVAADGGATEAGGCVDAVSGISLNSSLLLVPSGYKEDVVYSQIPTSGAGDLSFTRASNGTRVNSAGLVEVCPWNLLQQSENFSALYIAINSTISNNTTTAPNGTTTADSLIENTATDNHFIFADYTQQSGTQYTYSVYAKSIGGRNIRVSGSLGYSGAVIVDLSNGSVLSGSGVVENVGNGWYRISITATTTTSTVRVIIYAANGTSLSYTGNGTSGVYLWGGQLNIGSTAKPYFPTTDRLNVPRLTYQNGGGGCPSLLLEPQRTNSILRSEEFDNVVWTKTACSVTANSTISPDGTQNADTLTGDGTSSTHSVFQTASLTSGANYTISVYAKKNTNNFLQIYGFSTGYGVNSWANFDLNNGVVGSIGSSTTATITNVGNGWYRCTMSIVATSSVTDAFVLNLITSATSSRAENSTLSTSVFLWGCQFEAGAFATTYIPTTSSSATRVADFATTNNISTLFGSTEGSFFVDMTYDNGGASGSIPVFLRSSISPSYLYATYLQLQSGVIQLQVNNSGSGSAAITSSAIFTQGQRVKIAFGYKQNDFVLYVNGSLIGTDTSGNISSSLAFIDLGTYSLSASTFQYNGTISESVLFPTRLTNAELQALTTL